MSLSALVRTFAVALLVPALHAQVVTLPFPMELGPVEASAVEGLVLTPVRERIAALAGHSSVTLHGVPLPDGSLVDLELERIRIDTRGFAFQVDGRARPGLLDGLALSALSLWKGRVVGSPDSSVMLSFSHSGSRGWIQVGGDLVHLMPRPDANGDWSQGDALFVTEASLAQRGVTFDFACDARRPGVARDESARAPRVPLAPLTPGGPFAPGTPTSTGGTIGLGPQCSLRVCKIAIESDFQLYTLFNDLNALTTYVATLLSFVSDRYETQAGTLLTFPYVQFYTTASDPWLSQDSGGDCFAVLLEFQQALAGNLPANADLGHLLSGANLGCGVAWLDVLCDDTFNFSVSGNLNGQAQFPTQQQPNNWDFMVVAHEIGHNFDALHTHDYCPPLDECAPSGYFGQCQTQQVCTNQGTIMSYCHLCSGGTNNITTFFHTTSAADMTAAAQSCLPAFVSIGGDAPPLLAPNVATAVSADVIGTPVGPVTLFYRAGPGAFTAITMTSSGGGQFDAALPAPNCTATPEWYYAFTDQTCGPQTDPVGAPNNFYNALVGAPAPVLADDFEVDLGWSGTILGATSGSWQRGVPVNDPTWDADPFADHDGSGNCWLTENATGNTDVDGGAVALLSPAFSLTGGPAWITYAYYLYMTDELSTDRLIVEASSNGTNGPWVEVARHDTSGFVFWRTHTIDALALAAAGVAQTADMRLRFTVNDSDPQSIVEAGIDAFQAAVLTCSGVGTNYCTPTANSTGQPAILSATGSASVAANDLAMHAGPVTAPTQGVLVFAGNQASVPLGNGFRCVANPLFRLPAVHTTSGTLDFTVNNNLPPAVNHIVAGSTWNFQVWYRDFPAGGAHFNLSDGYQISFVP